MFDLNDTSRLLDESGVIFDFITGAYVTLANNFKPEEERWFDKWAPLLVVGAISAMAYPGISKGILNLGGVFAQAGGLALSTTGAVAVGGAMGGLSGLLTGMVTDNLSLKDILRSALAGAVTAGALDSLKQALPPGAMDILTKSGELSSTALGAVGARITIEGGIRVLMGGQFKDGALNTLASVLGEALAAQLNLELNANGAPSPEMASAARVVSRLITSAVRILADPSNPAYTLALGLIEEIVPKPAQAATDANPPEADIADITHGLSDGTDLTWGNAERGAAQSPANEPITVPEPPAGGSPAEPVADSHSGNDVASDAAPVPAQPDLSAGSPISPVIGDPFDDDDDPHDRPVANDSGHPQPVQEDQASSDNHQAPHPGIEVIVPGERTFTRENGERVTTMPSAPFVGEVRIDANAPLIPRSLLPEGVEPSQVYGVVDQVGHRAYAFDNRDDLGFLDQNLFNEGARKLVDRGVDGLQSGAVTPSDYLEASRYLSANDAGSMGQGTQTGSASNAELQQAVMRRQLFQSELSRQGIVPVADPGSFVGPLTEQQAEVLQQTNLLLDSEAASRVIQSREQGQFLSWAAATAVPLRLAQMGGTSVLVDSTLTLMAGGGRVLLTFGGLLAADALLPLTLLVFPSSLGMPPAVTQLNDTQRFVLSKGSEIRGNLEELQPDGQWRVVKADTQLVMQGNQRMALTDDEIREYVRVVGKPNDPGEPNPPLITPLPDTIQKPALPEEVTGENIPPIGLDGDWAELPLGWQDLIITNGNENSVPSLPDKLVGDQTDPRAGPSNSGSRHTSGALSPENGGVNDAEKDFAHLIGGSGKPFPENDSRSKIPGARVGDNGIWIRPGKPGQGARIEIPGRGSKPPETLHY